MAPSSLTVHNADEVTDRMDHAAHLWGVRQGRAAVKLVQAETHKGLALGVNAADWAPNLLDGHSGGNRLFRC
jgi:hypothetical protein